ncbi:MAG: hypothetical protein H0S79_16150 [Anaerolineaceae bacterium]|nr:hypothetical protein [Anaerolineaceae bacterium]
MKISKFRFLIILALLAVISIFAVQSAKAQEIQNNSGAIWTTDGSCGDATQDVNHFQKGHSVYINGDGFDAGSYEWKITGNPGGASADPGIVVASGTVIVDDSGSFCFNAYTIKNDDGGEYSVKVGNKGDNYRVDYGTPSVQVKVSGGCSWSEQGGSVRSVSLTINGASVTILKTGGGSYGPFTSSTSINLPAGSYTYSYEATAGFNGSGSGSFTVTECPDASASVTPDICRWDDQNKVSVNSVVITVSNAVVTISDSNGVVGVYSSSQTVTLPEGSYTYTWVAAQGYKGSGSGSFSLVSCEPGKGDVSVDVGECSFDQQEGSLINVALTIQNATLTIGGKDYTSSQTIKLAPGTYSYSWTASEGNTGSGSGSITVYGCEPAFAGVDLGTCSWDGQASSTSATLTVTGATLVIKSGENVFGTYGPGTHNVSFPEGSYTYTWTANENYTGSGSGSFSAVSCEPGKADASVDIGTCAYNDGQSLTTVSISISNAVLSIDGKEYTEAAVLKLAPGDYAYAWKAVEEGFEGSGEGVITIGSCTPKTSTDPDVPAGGLGPSVVNSLAPILAGVAGLGIASIFVIKGKKEN